ncbi:MAG: peptide chain release factor 1 [Clostridia bacterium]|nr:peptide chain release factor 1 [Clostridia bacterium]
MLSRLKEAEERYIALEARLSDPTVLSDIERFASVSREYKELTPVITCYRQYKDCLKRMEEASELRSTGDPELEELAAEEYDAAESEAARRLDELRILLLPRDPNDGRSVVVELRAGAGGEEACLFAANLFRMYSMYCASAGFGIGIVTENRTDLGGYRKLIFTIDGDGAHSRFTFESGVHEVKRVPLTEAQGRIQTSTVTVAVMPEAEEVDIDINPSDILFETCRSSGAGGQHINKTDSAVRLTHIPTGTVVECQQERSQFQNRDKAMQTLRSILYDRKCREQNEGIAAARRSMVGTGDRSERIRIYRYKDNMVRDCRVDEKTLHVNLDSFMNGEMAPLIDAIIAADTAEKLKNGDSGSL